MFNKNFYLCKFNFKKLSNGVNPKYMKNKILAILILFMITVPLVSQAAPFCPTTGTASTDLPRCINKIYTFSLGAAALLALLMMTLGGYYRMTSAGNAERASKGTDIIMSSLIGIVLLFGSYLLLRTINPDLVDFKLKSFDVYQTEVQQPTVPPTGQPRQ